MKKHTAKKTRIGVGLDGDQIARLDRLASKCALMGQCTENVSRGRQRVIWFLIEEASRALEEKIVKLTELEANLLLRSFRLEAAAGGSRRRAAMDADAQAVQRLIE